MFYVENVGDFNLFMPSQDIIPHALEQTQRRHKMNQEYLRQNEPIGLPAMRISGSYICPHAPDYVGLPTLLWDQARWVSLFQEMKDCGLHTAFFQASIWHELGECYYQSKRFAGEYRMWHVVEPMLAAANEVGIQVFLGGYGSVVGWLEKQDQSRIDREIERQLACMEELLALGDGFAGIYFSPETAFHGKRELEKEKLLNRLYRGYFSKIKDLAPDKLLAMSPASMYYENMAEDFADFWSGMLEGVPLDILIPQDSVGTGGCSLREQAEMWQLWKQTADSHQIRLWCHLELFERRSFAGTEPFVSASPERVAAQLVNVSPYIEKCMCFEFPYFAGNAKGGARLRDKIFTPEPSGALSV